MEAITDVNRLDDVIDIADFNSRVIDGYAADSSAESLEADIYTARSIIPGGTGSY